MICLCREFEPIFTRTYLHHTYTIFTPCSSGVFCSQLAQNTGNKLQKGGVYPATHEIAANGYSHCMRVFPKSVSSCAGLISLSPSDTPRDAYDTLNASIEHALHQLRSFMLFAHSHFTRNTEKRTVFVSTLASEVLKSDVPCLLHPPCWFGVPRNVLLQPKRWSRGKPPRAQATSDQQQSTTLELLRNSQSTRPSETV